MEMSVNKSVKIILEEDCVMHIIKSGFTKPQLYITVFETPYDTQQVDNYLYTFKDIYLIFGIDKNELKTYIDQL